MGMIAFVDAAFTAHPLDESPRNRLIEFWGVTSWDATVDGESITVHELTGIVVREADGSNPSTDGNIRFTRTSPIVSCEGNVVITASGSRYKLSGDSKEGALKLSIDTAPAIPPELWNPWIKDTNWHRTMPR